VRAAEPAEPRRKLSLADEIAELERTRIAEALAAYNGNHAHAARSIGMPLRTFSSKVKKYKLGDE
jgi:transcriptional regulator with GAF, ATPase, and Fis domain